MENITVGQIAMVLGFIVSLLGSLTYIAKVIKSAISKTLEPIQNSINDLDANQCKNFLVRFLADVEQGNTIDPVERERAYEVYEHYSKDLKRNSYIHQRWVELMER